MAKKEKTKTVAKKRPLTRKKTAKVVKPAGWFGMQTIGLLLFPRGWIIIG